MKREDIKTEVPWHIYILKVDNRGDRNHRWYGMDKCYYAGISTNVGHRMGDYIHRRGGFGWVNSHWPNARKVLVYVEHFFGTEWEATRREKQIKNLSVPEKEKLIKGPSNALICYKPITTIIIRNSEGTSDIVIPVI